MLSRRSFFHTAALGAAGLFSRKTFSKRAVKPVVVSTWNHGIAANAAAWGLLSEGGRALDAVEAGVRVTEDDPAVTTVGYGGMPDREGHVTLDACIMDEAGNCGAVAFLQDIRHPISVARKVMEETPHVMLVGAGARAFALEKGFPEENLLTPEAEAGWRAWLKESRYRPVINIENHDTIGMVALDADGNLSGACTTSGAAFKMHGRVGDSPLIGAGMFVDNEVGAACATGLGEAVISICGSHLVVELMRQGRSPAAACKEAVARIIRREKDLTGLQVGFLALNKDGAYGAFSIYSGFNYAARTPTADQLIDAPHDRT